MHGTANVSLCYGRKFRTEYILVAWSLIHNRPDAIQHLKTDVLPFFVAIQPQNNVIDAFSLLLQESRHLQFFVCLFLQRCCREKFLRINSVPVIELVMEIQGHYVPTHRGHFKFHRLFVELSVILVYWTSSIEPLSRLHLSLREKFGDWLSQGRLLCYHKYSLHSCWEMFLGCKGSLKILNTNKIFSIPPRGN